MKRILIVYFSSTGNTEMMAQAYSEGIGAAATLKPVSQATLAEIADYDGYAFGCSSCGAEELDDMEFEPYFAQIEHQLKDKPVALFGSYGWGDGEFMRTWRDRVVADGAKLFDESFITVDTPDPQVLEEIRQSASRFAQFVE